MIEQSAPLVLPMDVRDVDEVHTLASLCFDPPWDRGVFLEELERDWATHPAHRRRGYARSLMEDVLGFGQAHGVRYVSLEVRRTNVAARGLYASLGFHAIGVRPRYYADDGEDAVVMLKTM